MQCNRVLLLECMCISGIYVNQQKLIMIAVYEEAWKHSRCLINFMFSVLGHVSTSLQKGISFKRTAQGIKSACMCYYTDRGR